MKYAKSSNQLCSSTRDSSVLLCLMSKLCTAVASGLNGLVLDGPYFDISNSMAAHALMINIKVQNYQLLVNCNPIEHQDYLN